MKANASIPASLLAMLAAGLVFGLATGVASPTANAAEVFKCKDADGKVKYQSQPCQDKAAQEKLKIDRGPSRDESGDEAAASSSDTPQLDQMLASTDDPALKEQLELRKKQCEMARKNLKEYESADFLFEKNADGSQRKLTSDQVVKEKERVRRFIESECK